MPAISLQSTVELLRLNEVLLGADEVSFAFWMGWGLNRLWLDRVWWGSCRERSRCWIGSAIWRAMLAPYSLCVDSCQRQYKTCHSDRFQFVQTILFSRKLCSRFNSWKKKKKRISSRANESLLFTVSFCVVVVVVVVSENGVMLTLVTYNWLQNIN